MHVIGLTGGVGSGKTTASKFLQELGAHILDADKVGHESYLPDMPAWKDLIAAFGEDLLLPNQEIDRKKLGAIVFSNPENLAKLNSIVHPRMREMMEQQLEELKGQGVKLVVLEAAILIEANWQSLVDEVWTTEAPEATVVERLKARKNWTEQQVRDRIRSQMSPQERAAHAQVVIDTDCSLDEMRDRVKNLLETRAGSKE